MNPKRPRRRGRLQTTKGGVTVDVTGSCYHLSTGSEMGIVRPSSPVNRYRNDRLNWPTKGYLYRAIDILERIHDARGHVSSVAPECRRASWRFPRCIYHLLNSWVREENSRVALLAFPRPPEVIMLGWILERAQLGRNELTDLELQEQDFERLAAACGFLAGRGILVQSSDFDDCDAFCKQVQRVALGYGVTRVLAHDSILKSGRQLSSSSLTANLQEVSRTTNVELVLLGHDGTTHINDQAHEKPSISRDVSPRCRRGWR